MKYEPVIGLEVHVQVKTKTKLFCSCAIEFGEAPNYNVCPVCTGQPGALPVLNREVVNQAIRAALATNCKINQKNTFARKNYFYPDLPKGYQISQLETPFCENGQIEIITQGDTQDKSQIKTIRLNRIHIEEDAGKNVHQGADGILGASYSLVDLNRACTTLLEIVSEPDLRSAEEARVFVEQIRLTMQYIGVSDADMEKGQLRADVNVSLMLKGSTTYGTRAEIKNMNSFRGIERAIKYEIERQAEVLDNGGVVVQETRNYDDATETTTSMRSKEESHDYRYFPEPDLLPVEVSAEWIESIRKTLPEFPQARLARYISVLGLGEYDAMVLTNNKILGDFFDQSLSFCPDAAKLLCNWLTSDIAGVLKERNQELTDTKITPENLAKLISLIQKETISGKIAKTMLPEMLEKGTDAETLVQNSGMTQITDESELKALVEKIIATNPKQVEQFKAGEVKVIGFFVGQVMKETQGRANPQVVNKLLNSFLN